MISLDANASTALAPEVLEAMLPWLRDHHANPSGTHREARQARRAIARAREQVAELIGAEPDEIIFTGSGTESVNTALRSLTAVCPEGAVAISAIEHSAVMRTAEVLDREIRSLPVDPGGRVATDQLGTRLAGSAFVSVMWANNETGVIQPIEEVLEAAGALGLPVHSDAIQAVGKLPVSVRRLPVSLLSLSAHKFHGPKGVGALFVRRGQRFQGLLSGGGQEGGRRAGTENTAGIVGLGVAAELAGRRLADGAALRIAEIRNAFEREVLAVVPGATVNGDLQHRLANTSHISFAGCEAAGLLILLDQAGIACSAGSSCMSGSQQPSHVQVAMGILPALAKSSIRFSFPFLESPQNPQEIASVVATLVEKLRRVQGRGVGPVAVYTS